MLLLVHTWCPTLICEADEECTTLALSKFAGSFTCDLFMLNVLLQNTHLVERCGLYRVPACVSPSCRNNSLWAHFGVWLELILAAHSSPAERIAEHIAYTATLEDGF